MASTTQSTAAGVVPDGGPRVGLVQRRSVDSLDLDPFYAHLLAGMEEALDRAGGTVFVVFEESVAAELEVYRRWGADGQVDVVLLTDLVADDPRVEQCLSLGLHPVALGPEVPAGLSGIAVDELSAVRVAVEHVRADGHRRIAHVTGPRTLLHSESRAVALAALLAEEGLEALDAQGDYSRASGAEATRGLLALDPPPTAIIYDNDLMALGGHQALIEAGLSVPDDVSVLAWDDSVHCRLAEPPISAVSRDVHGLGTLLGALIVQGAGEVRVVQAPHARVVRRATTGPVPT
ncbi:LacI family DNA-binding transcriptional regulator [Microbacterium sp.]|uniref:LacI family DNA-binding transcriptional regulator n=1 Tax=Microbacterium sp. TaxID=51671 RepID=UPI002812778C|nr:substrate-binding domain-containing protein [Microbacterium sp.]